MRFEKKKLFFFGHPIELTAIQLAFILLTLLYIFLVLKFVIISETISTNLHLLGFFCAIFLLVSDMGAGTKTIVGRYSYVGNPSTTEPVLPGMAYAVFAGDQYYFITINGYWFSENRSWDGYMPEINDLVKITGYLYENSDVFGKTFYTIEAVSLKKIK